MTPFNYSEIFKLALPETLIVLGAILVLFLDLVVMRGRDGADRSSVLACVTAGVSALGIIAFEMLPKTGAVLDGMLVLSPTTVLVKQCILVFSALTALISWRVSFTEHIGEYFALILFATTGMLFLSSAQHLLMLFVSLELRAFRFTCWLHLTKKAGNRLRRR